MEKVVMTQTVFCFTIDTANPDLKVGEFGSFQVFENPSVKHMLSSWNVRNMSQSNVGTMVYVSILCEKRASGYF
jgi:hypothetical protein